MSRPLPRRPVRQRAGSRRAGSRRPDSRRAGRPRRLLALALLSLLCLMGWRCAAAARSPASESLESAASPAGAGILDGGGATALPSPSPDVALQALVEGAIDPANGTTSVVVRHLRSGASAASGERILFPSASLAKVPILVEVYRQLASGTLREDEALSITAESITDGAGVLQARVGERLRVSDLLRLSVGVSDNVAARLLLQRIGGVEAVNRTMAGLGLGQTRLYADDRPNTTTAAEMAALLAWIATRGPAAPSPGSSGRQDAPVQPAPAAPGAPPAPRAAPPLPDTVVGLLTLRQNQAWIARGVPAAVTVAHKSGQLPNVRHDAGIVFAPRGPYVVVVLTDSLADQGEAEDFIAALSRSLYEHFNRR